MTKRERMNVWSIVWAVVAAGIGELVVQLTNGNVPIPVGFAWLVPILIAMLVALTPQLKLGSEQSPSNSAGE